MMSFEQERFNQLVNTKRLFMIPIRIVMIGYVDVYTQYEHMIRLNGSHLLN